MRFRAIGVVVLLSLSVVLGGAILFVLAQDNRVFTVSKPNAKASDNRKGPNWLTEEEVKEAVQRWHNDTIKPLNIRVVRTDKQGPPREFLFRSGESDWLPVSEYIASAQDPSPRAWCVPVTYRVDRLTYSLLFVIDRGSVLTTFEHYKKAP